MRISWLPMLLTVGCSAPSSPPVIPQPVSIPIDAAPADAPAHADLAITSAADLGAAERAAFVRAKPVFLKFCAHCHTSRGRKSTAARLGAFDMTKYPFGGRYAKLVGGAVRDVLGQSGVPATMPQDRKGAVQGDDLALIVAWADAWSRAHNPAHEPQ